jgi:hypothetical protein
MLSSSSGPCTFTTTNDEINGGSKMVFTIGFTFLIVEMFCAVGSKHKPSDIVCLN